MRLDAIVLWVYQGQRRDTTHAQHQKDEYGHAAEYCRSDMTDYRLSNTVLCRKTTAFAVFHRDPVHQTQSSESTALSPPNLAKGHWETEREGDLEGKKRQCSRNSELPNSQYFVSLYIPTSTPLLNDGKSHHPAILLSPPLPSRGRGCLCCFRCYRFCERSRLAGPKMPSPGHITSNFDHGEECFAVTQMILLLVMTLVRQVMAESCNRRQAIGDAAKYAFLFPTLPLSVSAEESAA
eukprot:3078248-Rhodomonas_salina.1